MAETRLIQRYTGVFLEGNTWTVQGPRVNLGHVQRRGDIKEETRGEERRHKRGDKRR